MSRLALSADRAMRVIEFLTLHAPERFNLTEIAERTGINSASAHAVLMALLRRGYVQRHAVHKTYCLGPALIAVGTAARTQMPGICAAEAELDALGHELDVETFVHAYTEDEIVVVSSGPHLSPYGTVLLVGQRFPLAPPFGAVYIAFAAPEEIDRWLSRAEVPFTPTEEAEQRAVIQSVRTNGYAVGLESPTRQRVGALLAESAKTDMADTIELTHLLSDLARVYPVIGVESDKTYDVNTILAPVFDANQSVIASIALSGFPRPIPAEEVVEIGTRVRDVAWLVTKRTNGRLPPDIG